MDEGEGEVMGDDLRNESEERRKHERGEAINDALGVLEELMPGHIVIPREVQESVRKDRQERSRELRTLRADKERLEKGILFLCREGLDDCWVEHELNICMDSSVSDNEWLAAVEGFAKGTT